MSVGFALVSCGSGFVFCFLLFLVVDFASATALALFYRLQSCSQADESLFCIIKLVKNVVASGVCFVGDRALLTLILLGFAGWLLCGSLYLKLFIVGVVGCCSC
jgi:hypothetical protein